MPRTRKDEAPIAIDEAVITARYADLDGYTVGYETFHTEFDPAPLFQGLPDDRCQAPHFGIVVSGRLEIRYADSTEVYEAGDAYYCRPGHLPWPHTGCEVIEFTPTAELEASMSVVGANMAAAGIGASA
ncbi:MAG TPA: cupin domain-containing protein [Mycobacteriales bacterium]|nr:cupin domain-containing protein [Mycobacteriales bacterium]